MFPFFVQFIETLSGDAQLEQKVANAHMIFNIGGVLLFLPAIGLVERFLDKLVPVKNDEYARRNELESV